MQKFYLENSFAAIKDTENKYDTLPPFRPMKCIGNLLTSFVITGQKQLPKPTRKN